MENDLYLYHTNLRNIGLFITIALASNNFKFKNRFMKKEGKFIIVIIFLIISLLLNIELINERNKQKNNNNKSLDIIPYITLSLIIILILVELRNLIYNIL